MKCVINGLNVKVLCRAIHALAKIGDELHVEPLPNGLSFRSVNTSRSAFASFIFAPCYFSHYQYEGETDSHPENEDIKCKISMKSCLNVFRTPSSMDKNVESCHIKIGTQNDCLIFKIHFKYGISKKYYLPIIECEALQAIYKIDNVPNMLAAPSRVLVDAMHNFQLSQDEITLAVNSENVTISNFVENAPDPTKVMRTELSLNSGEFDVFSISEHTSITFRLKELRALLAFGEGVNLPISVNFETRGRPVVFVIKSTTFEANFVLATLSSPTDTQSNCSQSTSVTTEKSNRNPKRSNGQARTSNIEESSMETSRGATRTKTSHATVSLNREEMRSNSQSSLFDFNNIGTSSKRLQSTSAKRQKTADSHALHSLNLDEVDVPVEVDLEAADEEMIPSTTPLDTRSRFIFRRCFESTFDQRKIPGYNDVIAEDSAEEDNT